MPAGIRRPDRRVMIVFAIVLSIFAVAGGWLLNLRGRFSDPKPPQLIIVAPISSEIV